MKYEDFEIADGIYELKNGTVVRVWTQSDGQWACAARDHNAFCRRDHHISEEVEDPGPIPHLEAAMLANALAGQMDLVDHDTKGWLYHVNPTGEDAVDQIMARSGRTTADLEKMSRAEMLDFIFGKDAP